MKIHFLILSILLTIASAASFFERQLKSNILGKSSDRQVFNLNNGTIEQILDHHNVQDTRTWTQVC